MDALAHGGPALRGLAVDADGLVVEHHHLIDRRVLAHRDHDVPQGVHLAPDQGGVVERVAHRGGVRQELAEPRGCGRRERRKVEPVAGAVVGREGGVPAGAGEHRQASPHGAPGASGRNGLRLRQLEQLVHVLRPGHAGLLHERAEHAVVARHGAGVRRGRKRPGGRDADLEQGYAHAAVRACGEGLAQPAAVTVGLEVDGDRSNARPHLRAGRSSRPGRAPPSSRTRSRCAAAVRGAWRACSPPRCRSATRARPGRARAGAGRRPRAPRARAGPRSRCRSGRTGAGRGGARPRPARAPAWCPWRSRRSRRRRPRRRRTRSRPPPPRPRPHPPPGSRPPRRRAARAGPTATGSTARRAPPRGLGSRPRRCPGSPAARG